MPVALWQMHIFLFFRIHVFSLSRIDILCLVHSNVSANKILANIRKQLLMDIKYDFIYT